MNTALATQTHPLITPDHLRRLAVVYIRQSTEEQVRDNTGSTEYQRSLAAVAQSYGWPDSLIEVIDEDLGMSGSSSERRTGWQRLQMLVGAKRIGAVFVATISRLSRQLIDFEVFRLIAAANNTLIYTDGRFVDPADSNDIIFSQLTAMLASYENRQRVRLMSQARITKAKQGEMVSVLPVGWIKGPDGKYDYDPETKDIIRTIIDTFWRTRVLRRTAFALAKAGVQIPFRNGQRISFKKPTIDRVKRILLHPAYTGTYIYGRTQSQPGGPVMARGESKRMKVPEERWIKTFNHHPAYMSQEQQEEIKSILKKNRFPRRDRPGRGPALSQGLLRCAVCNRSLTVNYQRLKSYSYVCGWYVEPCTKFTSSEFDKNILAEVFKILKTPPLEVLRAALEETRSQERRQLNWIESERERLRHEERVAHERADLTRGSLPRVHLNALEKLEKVLEEKEQFEQKISLYPLVPKSHESEEELEELCRIASDVPALWHHPAVTNQERKEILRCIIDHIVVGATKERIDATIFWKSGSQTPLSMWRGLGRQNLIRELHAQNLTTLQIKEHLAAGKTSTGQRINMSLGRLHVILRTLRLKPKRHSADYASLQQKAAELNREGRTSDWIAQHFNEQGFASASGKPWTCYMVYWLLHTMADKPESLETVHRRAITEALARGLNHQQMAVEFNQKKLPRWQNNARPWTERNIKKRCFDLNWRRHKRAQKESTGTEPSEASDLPTTS
jgi:DNA invertase Pin-like site-specific DNA recombinase